MIAQVLVRFRVSALLACGAILLPGCSSTTDDGGGGGDAEDFEIQLGEAFTNNLAGFAQSLERLVLAASGQPQDGVTLTPINNGVQGSVGVDVNGDGSLETSVNGTLIFLNSEQGFAGGATLTITGVTGGAPQDAFGTATVTPVGPAAVTIANGSYETHTETRGNDLYIEDANLLVDGSGSTIYATGTAQFEFNDLEGTLTFLQTASGYGIRVSGPGFETFDVP